MPKYCLAATLLGWLLSGVWAARASTSRLASNSTTKQDPLAFLEFGDPTIQKPNTGGCWLFSVLEGLRIQGYIEAFFKQGVITVSEDNQGRYTWQTSASEQGRFAMYSQVTPLWQQVLESIFVNEFPGKSAADFQRRIQTRLGGGLRSDDIQSYLRRIDGKISVFQDVFYFKTGEKPANVKQFISKQSPAPSSGSTVVFTLDKGGTHAIAVTETPAFESGYGWVAKSYNQVTAAESEYLLNGPTCVSYYNNKVTCDSLWAYSISGLPVK